MESVYKEVVFICGVLNMDHSASIHPSALIIKVDGKPKVVKPKAHKEKLMKPTADKPSMVKPTASEPMVTKSTGDV